MVSVSTSGGLYQLTDGVSVPTAWVLRACVSTRSQLLSLSPDWVSVSTTVVSLSTARVSVSVSTAGPSIEQLPSHLNQHLPLHWTVLRAVKQYMYDKGVYLIARSVIFYSTQGRRCLSY